MIINDVEILERCRTSSLINPFVSSKIQVMGKRRIPSFGLSDHGYDLRFSGEGKVFVKQDKRWQGINNDYIIIRPRQHALLSTMEILNMPKDLVGTLFTKSTWARKGLIFSLAAVDAGWRGSLTIATHNPTSEQVKIYKGVGLVQIRFHKVTPAATSYEGSYQDTKEATVAPF